MLNSRTLIRLVILFLHTIIHSSSQRYPDFSVSDMCPRMFNKIFQHYVPKGNFSAGKYVKKESIHSLKECLEACCEEEKCNVLFMLKENCYHIECKTNELCLPEYRPNDNFEAVKMMLVSPLPPLQSWKEYQISNDDSYKEEEMLMDAESGYNDYLPCDLDMLESCPEYEICEARIPSSSRKKKGFCHCIEGYERNYTGSCNPRKETNVQSIPLPQSERHFIESETTSDKPTNSLVVSVRSKTVQLPENEVTLSAFTVPNGDHYAYNWKLISQPKGANSGTMNGQNSGVLKLGLLVEGLYIFKVTVTGNNAYGETLANVTVLPPERINKPPVAIITPSTQIVKFPIKAAVLDGSDSRDDDKIISWHWELQRGPLGYQPALGDSSTLELKDLTTPGDYTFKLTVEDSDHVKTSTTANITVVKLMDYPPESNAGQDVIIYLPVNNITLNGNMSTDDRGIVYWEWTKSPSDQNKAVDMQKTRTPYLELSNLEEGMYTFVLKVMDVSNQPSTSEVHVFVKPPTNKPPTANAGEDMKVSLPRTWVILDASGNSEDNSIISYSWRQLSGPSKVIFMPVNASKTNATELTKGEYQLEVTVIDSHGNKASDTVMVTVNQNENAAPTANAGGDRTIVLPVSVVALNGSGSHDDLAIKKWEWTRDSSSIALGRVISDSDKSSVLLLTDLIPGRYVFNLKVTDDQGLTGEDTVSIIVKPDPYLLYLVELTLNVDGGKLTVLQEQSLEAKLELLLRGSTIHVRELRREHNTCRSIIVFYVEHQENKTILPGPEVIKILKGKLRQDSGLLELSVANIQTAVCQNNCSGHGICDQATRLCLCEAFWMQNFVRKHFGDGDSNCDWSILYVVIVLFVGILIVAGCSWSVTCLLQKAFRRPRKRQRYSLIDDGEEAAMKVLNKSVMISESESDSDVLFNRREKSNGDTRNGNRPSNGFIKLGRRIRT